MSSHPLTDFEIQKYYQNEPKFSSVYSRNNLPNFDEYESIVSLHGFVSEC